MRQCCIWTQTGHQGDGAMSIFVGVCFSFTIYSTFWTSFLLDRLYGAIIPSALNVFSCQGFLILNCIIGGQALAVVSNKLDDTLGIIIIGVISLVVQF